ncbi:MAG: hypothetical protein JNL17_00040 [Cyclobacteriaceae bacterium]|nr:hypothetical protein [Cyclobacteriaceae bacterium]
MRNILLTILLVPCFAFGQKEELTMAAILSDAGTLAKKIEMELGQEIVRMEFDIVQTSKSTFRTLTADFEYGILAFGDFRIKDIDIKVYKWVNNQWSLVEKDEEVKPNAIVTFKPPFTAEYRIDIIAATFEEGHDVGHYGLIVFHD